MKFSIEPKDSHFVFGEDEGDELQRVEFTVEVHPDTHWERLMRFLERYAAANGMGYQDKNGSGQKWLTTNVEMRYIASKTMTVNRGDGV